MIYLVAALAFLWFFASRSGSLARFEAMVTARMLKTAGAVFAGLAALVVAMRGHFELALILGGVGLYLYNFAQKKAAPRVEKTSRAKVSRVRTAMIEMEFDSLSGAMRGLVLAGPDEGRMLDQMTRLQCDNVYGLCRRADPEGARLLEVYFDRRFAGWRQARQSDASARSGRARHSNRMSEDEAYEVLGLPRGAARDDVVRSHRSLMKKLHPDQGGSTDLAARVNEAKEVLMRRHN